MRALRNAGYPVRFLTNTTSQSRPAIVEKLRALGIPAQIEDVHSPPAAAGAFLRERGARAHLLVLDDTQEDFHDVPHTDDAPNYVVVGDLAGAGPSTASTTLFG